jgi:hypothetical protein
MRGLEENRANRIDDPIQPTMHLNRRLQTGVDGVKLGRVYDANGSTDLVSQGAKRWLISTS